jgi:hypothetical protein
MSTDEPGVLAGIDRRMASLRETDRQRRLALVGAVAVGFALVTFHWVGLFAAGALVGLTRTTLPRALVSGLAFGVAVLAVFFLLTPDVGPTNIGQLAPLSYLTVGLTLLGPTWGALVRGVV